LNVTLFIDLDGDLNNTVNNIFVFDNPNKKFGANVSNYNSTQRFRYLLESDNEIRKGNHIYQYYIEQVIPTTCGSVSCESIERHYIEFRDICIPRENETAVLFDPNCEFNDTDEFTLEIDFDAEYNATLGLINIDPEINIINVDTYADSVKNNVTTEPYPFAHNTLADFDVVLYMPFDLNGTTQYDYSRTDSDGSVEGLANWDTTGMIGADVIFQSASGDGVIDAGNTIGQMREFTTCAWLNPDTAGESSDSRIVHKGTSTSRIQLQIDNAYLPVGVGVVVNRVTEQAKVVTDTELTLDVWTHVCGTYNETEAPSIYFNAVEQSYGEEAGGSGATSSNVGDNLYIGNRGNLARDFDGMMDEVMVFNRSLTQVEVQEIFDNQSFRFSTRASQLFEQINITDATENRVNVTYNTTLVFQSSLQLRIREINTGLNTSWQNLTDGDNQLAIFNITNTVSNITLEFNFSVNSDNFYSPVLRDTISIDTWNDGVAPTPDDDFPSFFDFADNNGSLIDSGTATFNVTLNQTNGTVFLDIDGSNRTAFNDTGNVFNISVVLSSAGVFKYNWVAFGNGTNANQNTSLDRFYTVNASVTIPSFTAITPVNDSTFFEDIFNISLNATVLDQGDNIDIYLYGVNSTDTADFYTQGLLFKALNQVKHTSVQ